MHIIRSGRQTTIAVTLAVGIAALVALIPIAAALAATTPAAQTVTDDLFVYLLRDGKIAAAQRPVEIEGNRPGRASLRALLAGPTEAEEDAGLTTGIPNGTDLNDVTLDDATDVATVDLSDDFLSPPRSDEPDAEEEALIYLGRLAQVVYTLTQFPSITSVTFQIDGEPLTDLPVLETIETNPFNEPIDLAQPLDRATMEPVTPAIFVERPALGEDITFPLRVAGTANTFEAAFVLQLVDADGVVILEEPTTATSGTGTRGTFDLTLTPPTDVDLIDLTLVAFERSARDGEPINQVEIPLTLVP